MRRIKGLKLIMEIKPKEKVEEIKYGKIDPGFTQFDRDLMDYFIMKKMRECFGEKSYNSKELYPDPRVRRLKTKPTRKLKME